MKFEAEVLFYLLPEYPGWHWHWYVVVEVARQEPCLQGSAKHGEACGGGVFLSMCPLLQVLDPVGDFPNLLVGSQANGGSQLAKDPREPCRTNAGWGTTCCAQAALGSILKRLNYASIHVHIVHAEEQIIQKNQIMWMSLVRSLSAPGRVSNAEQ